jgi:hypothetical protein
MTAKEALKARIDELSEEEAAEWLARIEWESSDMETLSDEELAQLRAAEREFAAGESVDAEVVLRKLGL